MKEPVEQITIFRKDGCVHRIHALVHDDDGELFLVNVKPVWPITNFQEVEIALDNAIEQGRHRRKMEHLTDGSWMPRPGTKENTPKPTRPGRGLTMPSSDRLIDGDA